MLFRSKLFGQFVFWVLVFVLRFLELGFSLTGVVGLGLRVILFGDEMKIGVETSGNHFKHNAYGINIIKSCIFHLD